jgi:hypothetical protein
MIASFVAVAGAICTIGALVVAKADTTNPVIISMQGNTISETQPNKPVTISMQSNTLSATLSPTASTGNGSTPTLMAVYNVTDVQYADPRIFDVGGGDDTQTETYTLTIRRLGDNVSFEAVAPQSPTNSVAYTAWRYYTDDWSLWYEPERSVNNGVMPNFVTQKDGKAKLFPPNGDVPKVYQNESPSGPKIWYRNTNGVFYFDTVPEPVSDYSSPIVNVAASGLNPRNIFGAAWTGDFNSQITASFSNGEMLNEAEQDLSGTANLSLASERIIEATLKNSSRTLSYQLTGYEAVGHLSLPSKIVIDQVDNYNQFKYDTCTLTLVSASPTTNFSLPSPLASLTVRDYRPSGPNLTPGDYNADVYSPKPRIGHLEYGWTGRVPALSELSSGQFGPLHYPTNDASGAVSGF